MSFKTHCVRCVWTLTHLQTHLGDLTLRLLAYTCAVIVSLVALLSTASVARGASSSDASIRAKFLATIVIFNRDRQHLTGGAATAVYGTEMRTDMIIRRALISADAGSTIHGRAARSLALQGLNEVIDGLAVDIRIGEGDPTADIVLFARHWSTGVRLLHAAGVQLGVYR